MSGSWFIYIWSLETIRSCSQDANIRLYAYMRIYGVLNGSWLIHARDAVTGDYAVTLKRCKRTCICMYGVLSCSWLIHMCDLTTKDYAVTLPGCKCTFVCMSGNVWCVNGSWLIQTCDWSLETMRSRSQDADVRAHVCIGIYGVLNGSCICMYIYWIVRDSFIRATRSLVTMWSRSQDAHVCWNVYLVCWMVRDSFMCLGSSEGMQPRSSDVSSRLYVCICTRGVLKGSWLESVNGVRPRS